LSFLAPAISKKLLTTSRYQNRDFWKRARPSVELAYMSEPLNLGTRWGTVTHFVGRVK
jgi:hypothetical protein